MGTASNVLACRDGTIVVPLMRGARIQVYRANHEFVRGWFLEDGGSGVFKLVALSKDSFYVYTARGNHRFEFSLAGRLISESIYTEDYASLPGVRGEVTLPVPLHLLHPFVALMIAGVGGLLAIPSEQRRKSGVIMRKQNVPPYTPIVPERNASDRDSV